MRLLSVKIKFVNIIISSFYAIITDVTKFNNVQWYRKIKRESLIGFTQQNWRKFVRENFE